jgi:hypothetical protein
MGNNIFTPVEDMLFDPACQRNQLMYHVVSPNPTRDARETNERVRSLHWFKHYKIVSIQSNLTNQTY